MAFNLSFCYVKSEGSFCESSHMLKKNLLRELSQKAYVSVISICEIANEKIILESIVCISLTAALKIIRKYELQCVVHSTLKPTEIKL